MRKLVLFMHISVDGFAADKNGDIGWVHVDDEIFEYAGRRTGVADTALYGRKTYELMQSYWPTAAEQPNPSKHDLDHSKWYKNVDKVVLSTSLRGKKLPKTKIISDNIVDEIHNLKRRSGNEIIIFGSPGASHSLMAANLIDEYWLFVNPVLLGAGTPLFTDILDQTNLTLVTSHAFSSGVMCLQYQLQR
ncbi:MAG: dihydrofolate reductase family protein [Anaerolineaceae bacterium]|nr:dihydrofolate reductase family protein [Anaerolineaceae bacterium]